MAHLERPKDRDRPFSKSVASLDYSDDSMPSTNAADSAEDIDTGDRPTEYAGSTPRSVRNEHGGHDTGSADGRRFDTLDWDDGGMDDIGQLAQILGDQFMKDFSVRLRKGYAVVDQCVQDHFERRKMIPGLSSTLLKSASYRGTHSSNGVDEQIDDYYKEGLKRVDEKVQRYREREIKKVNGEVQQTWSDFAKWFIEQESNAYEEANDKFNKEAKKEKARLMAKIRAEVAKAKDLMMEKAEAEVTEWKGR